MRCFHFSNGYKTDEPRTTKSGSGVSSTSTSTSTDLDVRKLGSENVSDISNASSSAKISFASLSQKHSNLRVFTFAELKTATKSFSRALMLGEGGFGPVYRAQQQRITGKPSSPNTIALRLKVAQDAAKGLAYLHEGMEIQWNAKLSDFGLAKLGPADGLSHVSTAVVGTVGYAAPEYIQTGRLTAKSDVWSYGIFLYELITGRRPFDRNKPKDEQKLLDWVRPHLSDMKKFEQILDPRLNGKYDAKSAQRLAAIANQCLIRHPKNRPRMSDVVEMVNHVVKGMSSQTPDASVECAILAPDEEGSLQERWKRRILEHIKGDHKCLGWKSRRRGVASEDI
ncbi:hypothetical protein SASPL_125395 [Salvia splendens]|uniref:Protein kinase domain-containing protein n=1 Tax=Salvia splendens TaxID=180675 RepID=A0A8X8XDQ2_SALSN|nr:hypothetical protein SASPL_125395 [Salvia splendens]